jgi:hypothetical protein
MPAQVPITHPLDGYEKWRTLFPKVNDNFEALASNFYSDDNSAPAERFPFQWRADMGSTNGPYLYLGNEAADDWFCVAELDNADAVPPVFALGVLVTKDAEGTSGANKIKFSCQVTDPRGTVGAAAVTGRRLLTVIVATTSNGAPGGTQTLAVVTGALVATLAAGTVLLVETDADGLAEVTLEVTGAGDRYVRASCGQGRAFELQGTWA